MLGTACSGFLGTGLSCIAGTVATDRLSSAAYSEVASWPLLRGYCFSFSFFFFFWGVIDQSSLVLLTVEAFCRARDDGEDGYFVGQSREHESPGQGGL